MCKTKFLQMFSFSIILSSLHFLKLSFALLSYVISTAIPKIPPWFSTLLPWFSAFFSFPPRFQTQILRKLLLQFKNEHSPFLLRHNPRHQIIVYIIWDISDITKKLP